MYNYISLLFHGIIVGFIIFQTTMLTPIVFKALKPSAVSVLLRSIFPRFFMSIFFISFLILTLVFLKKTDHSNYNVNVITVCLSGLCYFLIPLTNSARDNRNSRLFSIYHNISVVSTLLILIINISVFF